MIKTSVQIGNATLYLGDCQDILPTLNTNIQAIITDPPYGIDYQSAWRIDKTTWKPKLENDNSPYLNWISDSVRLLVDGGCCLCFCRWDVEQIFRDALYAHELTIMSQVIWDRMSHGMGDLEGTFAPQHDNIIFATKGRFTFPGKRPYSVISIARIAPDKLVHPTEKPVSLLSYLVQHTTSVGQFVLDPLMGSGTTGAACMKLDRRFIGIEKDPHWFNVACKRIEQAQAQLRLF